MNRNNIITVKNIILFSVAVTLSMICAINYVHAQTPVKSTLGRSKAKTNTTDTGQNINVIHADRLGYKKLSDSLQIRYFSGKVQLRQNKTLFYADSAMLNVKTNVMEAFGHVHINDNDSINIYSDYLRYQSTDKKAFLKNNVKLSDSKSTLTTSQLDYDLNTRIAVYNLNGKLVSDSTVLTSVSGTYFGETRDATFSDNVVLIDPQYTIKTDTLGYNTYTKIATFTVPTFITMGPKSSIQTTSGYYDMTNKKSYFAKRPIMIDSSSTLISDEAAFEDSTGFGEARGNVIYKDTVQNIVVLCNDLKVNRKQSSFLATVNPVMITRQNNDSTFIAADTLYSARYADLSDTGNNVHSYAQPQNIAPRQNASANHLPLDSAENKPGTLQKKLPAQNNNLPYKKVGKSFVWQTDSAGKKPLNNIAKGVDSIPAEPKKKGIFGFLKKKENKDTVPSTGNVSVENAGKLTPGIIDSLKTVKSTPDSAALQQTKGVDLSRNNNVSKQDSIPQEDNKSRFVEAYYNVRIFNDSMQAVGDSMYYDSRDSVIQLFKNPVVWTTSNNQISQIIGDTIYVYTANNKPKYLRVWYNSLMISQSDTAHRPGTQDYFNQISGRTIEGWFTDGEIDSISAKGDAHRVYYLMDASNKYIGVNTETARKFDFYFADKELESEKSRNDIEGTVYPMRKVNHESIRLKGFQWLDNKRPKSKYELLAH